MSETVAVVHSREFPAPRSECWPQPTALWLVWKLPGALHKPDALNTLLGTNVAILLATLALLIVGLSL